MDNNNYNHLTPVIYVAESPEQAINYKWDSQASRLDRNVVVMNPDEIRELGNNNELFILPYDITPGEVLIRHPYNQGYILATEAEDEYLTASAEGLFLVARCLGATKIAYKKCNIAEYTREVDSNNNMSYKAVEVNTSIKSSKEQKLLKKIKITREFQKQEYTQQQFDKAKAVAAERGLLLSKDIRSLLDARDPALGAPMTRQTICIEVSSALNKVMDIAFSLNTVPTFKLGSTTRTVTKEKYELLVEWDITF